MTHETLHHDTVLESDLYVMWDEPLPPCEMRVARGWDAALHEAPEACGAPAVAVLTITCLAACRAPWRRSACASHVDGLRDGSRKRCGYCGAEATVGGAS